MKTMDIDRYAGLMNRGVTSSLRGLEKMIGRDIEVRSFDVNRIPATEIPELFGGPEGVTVGIYLSTSGSAKGHIMLMCDTRTARTLVDLLMGQPTQFNTTFSMADIDAIGEMGNVVGSLFLSALADDTGMYLRTSPPTVKIDMAGALLDVIAAETLATRDTAFVSETVFRTTDCDVVGTFIVLPGDDFTRALMAGEPE